MKLLEEREGVEILWAIHLSEAILERQAGDCSRSLRAKMRRDADSIGIVLAGTDEDVLGMLRVDRDSVALAYAREPRNGKMDRTTATVGNRQLLLGALRQRV